MLFDGLCLRRYVLLGDDQYMGWRLWVDIGKTDAQLILIDAIRWDNAGYNLAKQTICGHFGAFFIVENT